MYRLRISSAAVNRLRELPHPHQKAIVLALTEIEEDPMIGKPLTRELTGKFSYRVGVYRIIYKVNRKDKVIDILTAGHRATVYRV